MKISIIIPIYNSEKYLRRTIQSLLDQTYLNFEVLLIDDGSTDNSSQICRDITVEDKRFNYTYQENKGVAAARNTGLELSEGDYISFLDSDDTYDEVFLEYMINQITIKNFDICYSGYNIVNNNSEPIRVKTNFSEVNVLNKYLLGQIKINTNCWILRKEFIAEVKFEEGLNYGEDTLFFSKMLMNTNKVTYIPYYLTNYFRNSEATSLSTFDINKICADTYVMSEIRKELVSKGMLKEIEAIDFYKLPGLITYRIVRSYRKNIESKEILEYYTNYRDQLSKFKLINGLRSIKLKIYQIYLGLIIEKIRRGENL